MHYVWGQKIKLNLFVYIYTCHNLSTTLVEFSAVRETHGCLWGYCTIPELFWGITGRHIYKLGKIFQLEIPASKVIYIFYQRSQWYNSNCFVHEQKTQEFPFNQESLSWAKYIKMKWYYYAIATKPNCQTNCGNLSKCGALGPKVSQT